MKYILIILFMVGLIGCSSILKKQDPKFSLSQVEVEKGDRELNDLKEIQKELIEENNAQVEKMLLEFSKRYPSPRYRISYDFLRIWLLELNGDWKKAIENYREILSSENNPYVLAETSYRLGWCYMNISENEKALAAYLDAYNRRQFLLPEIGLTEIPAKISAVYTKIADRSLAQDYLKKAEDGIELVKKIKANSADKTWLVNVLYQMGHIYQSRIDMDSFTDEILAFKTSQMFLIRAVELNQEPNSQKSLAYLEKVYGQFFQHALKSQQDEKKALIRMILPMIYEAQTRRPYGDEASNDLQKQLYKFLDDLDQKLSAELTANPVYIRLTKEAEELESVKKNAELLDPNVVIPEATPGPLDNSEVDPNL